LEKYKETAAATNLKKMKQNEEETIIIENMIGKLDKKREVAINKKNKSFTKR
jgi:hypothetical protein